MNVKKVIGFLILKPVFSAKNFSTIGLVILFMAVYVFILGGKIPLDIPKLEQSGAFGSVKVQNSEESNSPDNVLGLTESEDRQIYINNSNKFGRVDVVKNPEKAAELNKDLLDLEGDNLNVDRTEHKIRLIENQRRSKDKFSEIQQRLNGIGK